MKIKFSRLVAAAAASAIAATALAPAASAAGRRTKAEKYGDSTYVERFMSMYDDVFTNGVQNGYLSSHNQVSGAFGIPYHSVEELCVEAPDYGHLTTSEAMSYLVWVAAMRDYLVTANSGYGSAGDLGKAWSTMEALIPSANSVSQSAIQTGFWGGTPSAQYSAEFDDPSKYPAAGDANNTGSDPLWSAWKSSYGSDSGVYLLHWLADVDDWYGYGGRSFSDSELKYGSFTFINSFQRGEQESCFETVPHPSVEKLAYGNNRGLIGIFSADSQPAAQWRYTNAPDAEGRAIQGVYFAGRLGVSGASSLATSAGKMSDYLRGDMFDKYYKAIGCQDVNNKANSYDSCHYLMAWYTAWGGAIDGAWRWKIGCSHIHQFYQNPLQAYISLNDSGIRSAMKATGAATDYTTSLTRQLEFYQWLQSAEGPFAGGATNSYGGQYQAYPSGTTTFYNLAYVEHPVYADPGSNHWIGNQVWATQRLAELYYYATEDGKTDVSGMLETILPSWVQFFVDNCKFDAAAAAATERDTDYAIPASLDWSGAPATWNGSKPSTSSVHCSITAYTTSDIGCVASLANTLLWYAATVGVDDTLGGQAYETAKKLIDRAWDLNRDDIGVSGIESNGSFKRIFTETVYIPNSYVGTMPNGDALKNGVKFCDIRTEYRFNDRYNEVKSYYDTNGETEGYDFYLHRFWHAGDYLMALGTMATLFPDAVPDDSDPVSNVLWGDANCDGTVDVRDVAMAAKVASGANVTISDQGLLNIDVKAGSGINVQDVALIAKLAAGLLAQSDCPK